MTQKRMPLAMARVRGAKGQWLVVNPCPYCERWHSHAVAKDGHLWRKAPCCGDTYLLVLSDDRQQAPEALPAPPGEAVYLNPHTRYLPGIMAAVARERAYQDAKHGTIDEHGHTLGEWMGLMRRRLMLAEHALLKEDWYAVQFEILKAVALGVACMQQHGFVEREEDGIC